MIQITREALIEEKTTSTSVDTSVCFEALCRFSLVVTISPQFWTAYETPHSGTNSTSSKVSLSEWHLHQAP